jgi:hypothetical protein
MNEYFNSFVVSIFNCYNSFFELFKKIYSLIIGNNWLTLIICVAILYMIIDFFADFQTIAERLFTQDHTLLTDDREERVNHPSLFIPHYRGLGKINEDKVELFDYNWLEDDDLEEDDY